MEVGKSINTYGEIWCANHSIGTWTIAVKDSANVTKFVKALDELFADNPESLTLNTGKHVLWLTLAQKF